MKRRFIFFFILLVFILTSCVEAQSVSLGNVIITGPDANGSYNVSGSVTVTGIQDMPKDYRDYVQVTLQSVSLPDGKWPVLPDNKGLYSEPLSPELPKSSCEAVGQACLKSEEINGVNCTVHALFLKYLQVSDEGVTFSFSKTVKPHVDPRLGNNVKVTHTRVVARLAQVKSEWTGMQLKYYNKIFGPVSLTKEEIKGKKIKGKAELEIGGYYPFGPVRNAVVRLNHKTNIYESSTDITGNFEFYQEYEKDDDIEVTLYLMDNVDGKNYIKIRDDSAPSCDNVSITQRLKITEEDVRKGEKEVNFKFDPSSLPPSGYLSGSRSSTLSGLVKEYIIFEDAVDFALNDLKANIKSVVIRINYTYWPEAAAYGYPPYTSGELEIQLGRAYLNFLPYQKFFYASPLPEFHEFGHHITHSQFIPAYPPNWINHGGMLNPTTHDSLSEGEATFFSMLIRNYKNAFIPIPGQDISLISEKDVYVLRGNNFEINLKAWWHEKGCNREDRAVASLLWDLYDDKRDRLDDVYYRRENEFYDEISLSLSEIWEIIKSDKTQTVLDLYSTLKVKYPEKSQQIDDVFAAHGFYRDKDIGDGKYNYIEPFLDNPPRNWTYDVGERFVDLGRGHEHPWGQRYDAGVDEIGTASNYAMPERKSLQAVEGSNVLVKNPELNEFLIKVEFEPEYRSLNYQYVACSYEGLLYITFPPSNYNTNMTVTPIENGKLAEKSLKIKSSEYFDLLSKTTEDYFMEHDFGAGAAHFTGLTFESRSKSRGSEVQIPLTMWGVKDKIGNIDLTLSYYPSVLEAKDVIKGSLTSASLFDYNIPSKGKIKISLADKEGFTGNGSIANIVFSVIGSEGATSPLNISEVSANKADDYKAMDIPVKNGLFTVVGIEQCRGDCNGDGKITALDALCALQMSVGKKTEDLTMDVNSDKKVTSLDGRSILKLAVGS